jgi:hypothetical protein
MKSKKGRWAGNVALAGNACRLLVGSHKERGHKEVVDVGEGIVLKYIG